MHSRINDTHALTLHARAVVQLRFVTERKKKKKMKPNLYPGRFQSERPSKNVL